MFVGITNTPRDYAWGSRTAIAEVLGTEPSGAPEAELWLGAHPGSPSRITDPESVGGATTVPEWISADPQTTLGPVSTGLREGDPVHLPFLLKLLAADGPLSLQAHPTLERARRGFSAENEAGVESDAPHRNYKDALHKPELIYALSERFDALCGFRAVEEARAVFAALADRDASDAAGSSPFSFVLDRLGDPGGLRSAFEAIMAGGTEVDAVVERTVAIAAASEAADSPCGAAADGDPLRRDLALVRRLAAAYPGDPGIVTALLLNYVSLSRGEALYLPAGNIHAYLSGLGVELMAASDNVLRGGLTPKHVDVAELLDVLDFRAVPVPYLHPHRPEEGVEVFRPEVPDFQLVRVALDATTLQAGYRIAGPAIAICVSGQVTIAGSRTEASVARGQAVYITPDEAELQFIGEGELFLATTNA
ncbi:mannose-6-phosphate isomerase, class I [Planctomonas psychrotolerans]|uniref:mannose-6-phosphate isomerase, class I n=1 Tax=Planctomonas psychrotolerans TaxID=2528712 RepID=UPI001239D65E|nr:mannose-6-phosphate isomerase, class I [Planctomonas psychrotolerans]